MSAASEETLPPGWAWATVGELADEVRNGVSTKPDAVAGLPILRISAIRPMRVNVADVRFLPAEAANLDSYQLREGDVLFTRYNGNRDLVGACAAIERVAGVLLYPDKLIRVRLAPAAVDARYVAYASNTKFARQHFDSRSRSAAGQIGISGEDVRSLPVPVPPLAEQRRIVAALDEALGRVRAARASLDEAPALLERARQAVLAAAFRGELTEAWRAETSGCSAPSQWGDYPQVALDELTTQVTSGSRGWSSYCGQSGTARFVRVGDLNRSSLNVDVDTAIYVTPPPGAEGERTRLAEGDVLISITADVGMIGLVPHHPEPLFTNQHVAMCRLNKGAFPRFVAYALKDPNGAQRTIFGASYGATKASLSLKQIRALTLPLPPLAEQHEIVRRVDAALAKLDAVAAAVEATRAQLDAIERAVLAKAFRGELVAQDAADEPAAEMLARLRESRAATPTKRGRRAAPSPRVETRGNEGNS